MENSIFCYTAQEYKNNGKLRITVVSLPAEDLEDIQTEIGSGIRVLLSLSGAYEYNRVLNAGSALFPSQTTITLHLQSVNSVISLSDTIVILNICEV
jgi:hypothetical protein